MDQRMRRNRYGAFVADERRSCSCTANDSSSRLLIQVHPAVDLPHLLIIPAVIETDTEEWSVCGVQSLEI